MTRPSAASGADPAGPAGPAGPAASGAGPVDPAASGADQGRRQLAYAIVACLAGAGLALFAATRTWMVRETIRAAPLPSLTEANTGGDLAPWVPPLALVGLAGAGAVLATRGSARALVGLLAAVCGCGVLAGAGYAIVDGAVLLWPAVAGLGGAALTAGGVLTALRGRRWPAMGARYEARPARVAARDTVQTWAALDRGEDPTVE